MRYRSILFCFWSLLLLYPKPGRAQFDREEFDAAVNKAVAEGFSGTILAAENGNVLYHEAFGFRDHEKKTPLQRSDIFELASVSKQFTAMIIMMLQEKNRLRLDDPIDQYILLPYTGITIRHLLHHTSGLPDYQAVMDQHWDKTKAASNKDIIEYLNTYSPAKLFDPGDKYEYSNTGYVLLASIAEQTSGTDFIQLCREWIFQKLNMAVTDIRTLEQKAQTNTFALGHVYASKEQSYVRADRFRSSDYTFWLGNRKGPGRISSNAEDLLRWDQALYGSSLVSASTLEKAFESGRLNNGNATGYGFGWMLNDSTDGDHKVVYHTGDNPGYQTKIVRLLNKRRVLILLCNNDYQSFHSLSSVLETILKK